MDMLTDEEKKFLIMLRDNFLEQDGWGECATNPPKKGLMSLVDRGYCKLSPARSGPLRLLTGSVMIALTEAGKFAVTPVPTPKSTGFSPTN